MDYSEETTWTIRLEVEAKFPEDYEGEEDGYVWRERFRQEVQPAVATAVFRQLQALEGWKVRPANRGLPATEELLIRIEREV